ncbi:MAG TPA: hypothetical protein VEI28_01785 [Thermodesulfovibrionales bacterium]|nr:hypothetical protein [Thermodesulfovibrionales bacterium]
MGEAIRYINNFLYFVIRPDTRREKPVLIYCSGVNISRFTPLTRGQHGIGSSPVMRGLQLVNLGVRHLALSRGATPKAIRGNECEGIVPTKETWYTERLLIENASESFPDEILHYCVIGLLKKIFKASMREVHLPETLPGAEELEVFIQGQCKKYGA